MKLLATITMLFMANPKILEVEEFTLQWELNDDYVRFTLTAPTDGWVAIGFTEDEEIVNSNLIMARMKDAVAYAEDQYVVGFGKHPTVQSLGVEARIFDVSGKEHGTSTSMSFSISQERLDDYHFNLTEGTEINVWLAYSVSDDFDHHSRKRILRRIKI